MRARVALLAGVVAVATCVGLGSTQATSAAKPRDKLIAPGGYGPFCGGDPNCPPGHVPAALRRPLRLAALRRGTPCPVSAPGRSVSPYYSPAVGAGPVYAISLFSLAQTGVLPYDYPPRKNWIFRGSLWGGQALKWLGEPTYGGPVLIRGRQLNGPHLLGFESFTVPYSEMQVPPGQGDPQTDGWRFWGGYARFRASGCYGVQVDGTNFSEVIVFKATARAPT